MTSDNEVTVSDGLGTVCVCVWRGVLWHVFTIEMLSLISVVSRKTIATLMGI
jgi:hypothetical protein